MHLAGAKRFLNVFLLSLLNLAVIASLRSLPLVAEYGYTSIALYLISAIGFLFPVALSSAELATGWSETGGIYLWVKEAFGARCGFFAIWMQWFHSLMLFPAILSFAATAFAYIFHPPLAESKLFLFCFILIGFLGDDHLQFICPENIERF